MVPVLRFHFSGQQVIERFLMFLQCSVDAFVNRPFARGYVAVFSRVCNILLLRFWSLFFTLFAFWFVNS